MVLPTGTNIIKLFTTVTYEWGQQIRVFVPGAPFQPSLMFATGAYPSGVPVRSSPLEEAHSQTLGQDRKACQ